MEIHVWLDDDNSPESDMESYNQEAQASILIQAYLRFIFLWQAVFRLSDVGLVCTFLLISARNLQLSTLREYVSKLPKTVYAARKM